MKFYARSILPVTTLVLALALAGCSERYVVTANSEVLVVVDDVSERDGHPAATIYYSLAQPLILSEADSKRAVAMTYKAAFRCEEKMWGHYSQSVTTESGETIISQEAQPVMLKSSPGTVADSVLRTVCEPDARSQAATRRPLRSIQKDYLERAGLRRGAGK